jgi:peroxiredoxin
MKNFYYILIIATLVLSCSRGAKIEIRGRVENGSRLMIFLDEQGIGEIHKKDSTRSKQDGSFVLSDRIEIPTFYNLHLGNRSIIPLLVSPGETVEIHTRFEKFSSGYEVSGSVGSMQLQQLNRRMAKTRKSLDSLDLLTEKPNAGEEIPAGIREAYDRVIRDQRRSSIEFVLENMNSMVAIYALYQKYDDNNFVLNTTRDIQLLKITSQALDTVYPGSEYVESLKRDAANLEQELQASRIRRLMETAPAASFPDIRLPDPRGDTVALSSFAGKLILLSFWASWNAPSVNLNQEFSRLYDKYHERGLEIYQVSFDTDPDRWMAAIRYDELPWTNVSELSYPESSVAGYYNVTQIPTFFMIGRDGQILGRDYDLIALDRYIADQLN